MIGYSNSFADFEVSDYVISMDEVIAQILKYNNRVSKPHGKAANKDLRFRVRSKQQNYCLFIETILYQISDRKERKWFKETVNHIQNDDLEYGETWVSTLYDPIITKI